MLSLTTVNIETESNFFQTLIVTSAVEEFPTLNGRESSLTCLQELAIGTYIEALESSHPF
jgi:hypothetical protein